ncbi:putative hydrolase [Saccharomycopsis crataegensis]|uniref:Probable metalloprotease ARX1 n=1 Tax=Saccharomycopsis crataegensis TaxID=43959 RepID=A0AAV5QK34_9ASCO|nr:putative hydrolase [Saccharomycopsis crataegensis]
MEISALPDHQDLLLTGKNVLNETVLDKYRLAGQISQTALKYIISLIHDSYHLGKTSPPLTPVELCLLGDSYLYTALSSVYQKSVTEKGIAQPVSIDVNDVAVGVSPEIGTTAEKINRAFVPGDIVKISLGAHVDGYTANVSHTIVIYPPSTDASEPKPSGPLLGSKADAICAAYIATEAAISLLGCALSPEKLPGAYAGRGKVTGQMLREVVDGIAKSFGCVVAPGSKIRRLRRFLAGQAENIVAEKDFKGVIWSEAHQEFAMLQKSQKLNSEQSALVSVDNHQNFNKLGVSESSAIPTDNFVVVAGEVYSVDIRMASVSRFEAAGLVTLQNIDEFSGKNNSKDDIVAKSDVYIRDFAMNYTLKLKSSRSLLSRVEKTSSVYPFKLAHYADSFPIKTTLSVDEQRSLLDQVRKDINKQKLGLSECVNNHLIVAKKMHLAKFLPLDVILNSSNENARNSGADLTLMHNTLPGFEVPLPKLGITHLKLRSLIKHAEPIDVARESATVVLDNFDNEKRVVRLTGSTKFFPANWVHSDFKLQDETTEALIKLTQDQRFGIKVKECQPMKLTDIKGAAGDQMALD